MPCRADGLQGQPRATADGDGDDGQADGDALPRLEDPGTVKTQNVAAVVCAEGIVSSAVRLELGAMATDIVPRICILTNASISYRCVGFDASLGCIIRK